MIRRPKALYPTAPAVHGERQVAEITVAAGSHSEIARWYGVARSTVGDIKSGRRRGVTAEQYATAGRRT